MNLFDSLWFCFGEEYPRKVGFEVYFPEKERRGLEGPFGVSVSFFWRYIALEWRFSTWGRR